MKEALRLDAARFARLQATLRELTANITP